MDIECKKCGKVLNADGAFGIVLCDCGAAMAVPPYAKYGDRLKTKSFVAKLRGEPFYNPALNLFWARDEKQIVLEFDPANIYDANAIRVLDKSNHALLGYVERRVADEVGCVDGEVVGLDGALQLKGKNNFVVAFTCHYVPTERCETKSEKSEKIVVSCPLCFEEYETDASAVIGETLTCVTCGAKWQIIQWGATPQQPEPIDDIDAAVSGAEVQYQPKSSEAIQFPPLSEINRENRFFGKCVLFTGFCAEEKEQLAPIVDFLQMRQAVGVCQKLDFLICGGNAGPSKIKKAEEMGKSIIQAADFIREIAASIK